MKKNVILLLLVASSAIISSCSSVFSSNKLPNDLIPKDTMVEMIAEQLIYESTLDFVKQEIERGDTVLYQNVSFMTTGDSISTDSFQMGSAHVLSLLSGNYYGPWLKKWGYTNQQYEKSLKYYFNTSKTTDDIINRVKKRITEKYGNTIPPTTQSPAMPH